MGSLQDFSALMLTPTFQPDFGTASYLMSPVIGAVAFILSIIGVIALLMFLLRVGVDIIYLSGLGSVIDSSERAQQALGNLKILGDNDYSDPGKFIGKAAPKYLIYLVVIALLISQAYLPLVVSAIDVAGSVIVKVAGIDAAGYVDSISIDDLEQFKGGDYAGLVKYYNECIIVMNQNRILANKNGITQDQLIGYKTSYSNAYKAAIAAAAEIETAKGTIRSAQASRALTDAEKNLLGVNTNTHKERYDPMLIE